MIDFLHTSRPLSQNDLECIETIQMSAKMMSSIVNDALGKFY